MTFKEQYVKLHDVSRYVTHPRFVEILRRAGITSPHSVKTYWDIWQKGLYSTISSEVFTQELIDVFIAFESEIDKINKFWVSSSNGEREMVKVVYQKGDDLLAVECNPREYEGAKTLTAIYENCDKMIAILKKVDNFRLEKQDSRESKDWCNVFEYDFFHTSDNYTRGDKIIITIDGCFKELLYTEKYGYLTSKGEANFDTEKVEFPEELVNTKPDQRGSHYLVTMNTNYRLMGNLLTDKNLLRGLKTRE